MGYDANKALYERIKELNCLYDISRLFSQESLPMGELLQKVTGIIVTAWQNPENTCACISLNRRKICSINYRETRHRLQEPVRIGKKPAGFVEVGWLGAEPVEESRIFLEDEKSLLQAIAESVGRIVEKKAAESSLRQATRELRKRKAELEKKNIALKEIIAQIEAEKRELQERFRANIELTVLPALRRLKSSGALQEAQLGYIKVIEQSLVNISSSFARRVMSDRLKLSPREVEVSNLIKNGLNNKEISGLLHVSVLTVERHRHNIRKKLGISNEKVNLTTFLNEL